MNDETPYAEPALPDRVALARELIDLYKHLLDKRPASVPAALYPMGYPYGGPMSGAFRPALSSGPPAGEVQAPPPKTDNHLDRIMGMLERLVSEGEPAPGGSKIITSPPLVVSGAITSGTLPPFPIR